MNPEQLQNTSNLTPAELDSFLKLPKDQQEKEKDDRLVHLKSLNDQLDLAIQEGLKTGKPEEAQRLLEELRRGVQDLGQEIEATESPEKENPEKMLKIDRNINLVEDFLKKSETEGGLGIDWLDSENPIAESDERNKGLSEIDLSRVRLDTEWFRDELKKKGGHVPGVKRLEDLKKRDNIRLDLFALASLWNLYKGNEEQKKEFKEKLLVISKANDLNVEDLKKKAMFFDGTIVRSRGPGGYRLALSLYWRDSEWKCIRNNLDVGWRDNSPSLVLTN